MGIESATYTDSLGREVRSSSLGINTDTTYTKDGKEFSKITLPENMPDDKKKINISLYGENGNLTHNISEPVFADGSYKVDDKSIVTASVSDANGKEKETTDALGNTTLYDYDEKGELSKITMPSAVHIDPNTKSSENASSHVSFKNGKLSDGNSTTSDLTIDALGRLSKVTKDVNGKEISTTDYGQSNEQAGAGIETKYEYDNKGNLTKETYANGDYKEYSYDARGNTISTKTYKKENNGYSEQLSSALEYDDFDRLLSRIDYSGSGNDKTAIYYQSIVFLHVTVMLILKKLLLL